MLIRAGHFLFLGFSPIYKECLALFA